MNNNQRTIESYDKNIAKYCAAMYPYVDGLLKEWVDTILTGLAPTAHILELGSGDGRDARYIETLGYAVERTDASVGFVNYLRSQGYSARQLDALEVDYGGIYELIFANAVYVHFNATELTRILSNATKNLAPNGILAFSLKAGRGEEWSTEKLGDKRYFKYWDEPTLLDLIQKTDLKVTYFKEATASDSGVIWYRLVTKLK